MIITAKQAHEKAEQERILRKEKGILETLKWCEWAGDHIRSDSEKGLMNTSFSLPQSLISRCFTQEDLYSAITGVFVSLGYEVEIQMGRLYLAW